jgi:tetratricopeptide (TPR) repeat protein
LVTSARRYFEQATRLAPDSVTAQNNLGVVLLMLKEYYPAREAFRTAFALSSGQSEMAERGLNRVEAEIALIEGDGQANPAISHDVLRLGSSEFRLIESAPPRADVPAE